jgi:hypothetical protein
MLLPRAHRQGSAAALHRIPVLPILLTLAAIACVTGAAKAAELLVRRQ